MAHKLNTIGTGARSRIRIFELGISEKICAIFLTLIVKVRFSIRR